MSVTSSNNSSENNLTPDELINSQQRQQLTCCSVNHNLANHHNSYPLYENSNFSTTSANYVNDNHMKNNFTTILEVPRSSNQATSSQLTTGNQLITNISTNLTNHVSNVISNCNSNNCNSNSYQRFNLNNNQLSKIDHYGKSNLIKLNTSTGLIDHYANLPQQPPPPPPQQQQQQFLIEKQQFNNINQSVNNNQISSSFSNNIYALKQQQLSNADSSNNSSNNNICLIESQSSNGSRSCLTNLTTPESKSNERLSVLSVLSKSQPDLSNLENEMNQINIKTTNVPSNRTSLINNQISKLESNSDFDLLRIENAYLKEKLEDYLKKISKLQKFEHEIQKVNQIEAMYNELMLAAEKKEKLERAARYKLEVEIKRLHQQNKQNLIKIDQLTSALANMTSKEEKENEIKKEDTQKTDLLFSQLLAQNKELINTKDRQEIELQTQRLTLQEQRNHIQILDQALLNTQNNVITLENKLRKKMIYEEQADKLQKAFNHLQVTSERRLQMEKRTRTYLEKELEILKANQKQNNSNANAQTANNEGELEKLKKQNREYESKVLNLEAEVSKWEQKYLEENTMRQIEANSGIVPKEDTKDAKIAALETEKLILEARNERLRYMDESTIKDLETKLAEKDAMIKVLQHHSIDRDNNSLQSILAQRSSLNKHTRSASSTGLGNNSTNSQAQNNLLVRNLKNLSISGCPTSTINRYSDLASSNSASSRTSGYSTTSNSSTGSCTVTEVEANGSLKANSLIDDESFKEFDKRLANKNSIIRALRNEREKCPDRYFKI